MYKRRGDQAASRNALSLMVGLMQMMLFVVLVPETGFAGLDQLDPNNSYFFAVTGYDSAGLRSIDFSIVDSTEPTPPAVTVTSPSSSSSDLGIVSILVSAPESLGIVKTELLVNGLPVAETATSPHAYSWDTSALVGGDYSVSVRAFDGAGNVALSDEIAVTVAGDVTPPTVSLSLPANNATVSGMVGIKANANDNAGVTMVELYLDGTLLQSNQSSASYNWDTDAVPNGSHTLTAKAYDAAGNIGVSAPVVVTVVDVNVGDLSPPTVTAFSMRNITNSTNVAVSSFTASDNVGVTGYLITESATAPVAYEAGWSTTAPTSFSFSGTGTRTAYAWAKDAAGRVSAGKAATVIIDTALPVIRSLSLATGTSTVTINVAASDNVGVTKMELFADNELQLQTAAGNFSYVWTAGLKKSQSITVKVYDAAGNVRSQSFRVSKI